MPVPVAALPQAARHWLIVLGACKLVPEVCWDSQSCREVQGTTPSFTCKFTQSFIFIAKCSRFSWKITEQHSATTNSFKQQQINVSTQANSPPVHFIQSQL